MPQFGLRAFLIFSAVAAPVLASLVWLFQPAKPLVYAPVTGRVVFNDGSSLPGMHVGFVPVDRPLMPVPGGWTSADGTFELFTHTEGDGVPVGEYQVGVSLRGTQPEMLDPRLSNPETSGMSFTVRSGMNRYELRLPTPPPSEFGWPWVKFDENKFGSIAGQPVILNGKSLKSDKGEPLMRFSVTNTEFDDLLEAISDHFDTTIIVRPAELASRGITLDATGADAQTVLSEVAKQCKLKLEQLGGSKWRLALTDSDSTSERIIEYHE